MQIDFGDKDVKIYLAAAGAGKTTAAMKELQTLLEEYRPDEIAFVTFTRKGVQNGIDRAMQVNRYLTEDDLVYFRTLNSLCFREAGLKGVNVISKKDLQLFNKHFGFSLTGRDQNAQPTKDDKLLERYNAIRAGNPTIAFDNTFNDDTGRYEVLIESYEGFKKANDFVDFTDCFSKYMEVGEPIEGLRVCLVDEAQDLTPLQWECVERLSQKCEKIRCYGDDYQALYTYAGASPEILINLSRRYPTIRLEKSYRLSRRVYDFSRNITFLLRDKIEKDYAPVREKEGVVDYIRDREHIYNMLLSGLSRKDPESYMLLFRTNLNITKVTDGLIERGIPYHTDKGFCISRQTVRLLSRYFELAKGFDFDWEEREEFANRYKITDFSLKPIENNILPRTREGAFIQDVIDNFGMDYIRQESRTIVPRLFASTVHKVKGGEADNVFYFLDATRQTSYYLTHSPDIELRVFYVAATRARNNFYMVEGRNRDNLNELADFIQGVVND